jgi:integrase
MAPKSARAGQVGPYWLSKRPGSDNWYRTWFDTTARQTRRVSLGTDDFEQAQNYLVQWFVESRKIVNQPPDQITVAELLARDFKSRTSSLPSAGTIKISLGFWTSFFEGATISDINAHTVRAFVDALREQGKSNGYIRRILSDGKAAINSANKRGEITAAPFIDLSLAPEGKPRERILSVDEMAALLDAATVRHLRTYLLLAIATMARPSAIVQLQTSSIDFESKTFNLLPYNARQNNKRRPIVPIARSIMPMLYRIPHGHLVTYEGRLMDSVRSAFNKAAKAAGIATPINRYVIRHTVISEAMKRCSEPWQVERFAGHATGNRTTERYVKYSPGYLSLARDATDAYFADVAAKMKTELLAFTSATALHLRSSNETALAKTGGIMVEPRGVEPLTSSLPAKRSTS